MIGEPEDLSFLNSGGLRLEIDYTLRVTNDRRNLVYPFYIIPGERE